MKLVKVLKLLICFVLIIPLFATNASANANYDHDALMQYEGYGKAMYDSIVEQTTFIAGQYTDNKDYVRGSMNQIKDYADFWFEEAKELSGMCGYGDSSDKCYGEIVERGGAYVLTVGDWIKNLFSNYEESVNSTIGDYSYYGAYFEMNSGNDWDVTVKNGYYAVVTGHGGSHTIESGAKFSYSVRMDQSNLWYVLNTGSGSYLASPFIKFGSATQLDAQRIKDESARNGSVSSIVGFGYSKGYTISVFQNDKTPVNLEKPINNVSNINRYIQENSPTVAIPILKPSLVCPDGTKIQMSISGSTFLSSDGSVMLVEKDGTAEVNSQLCNLNWEKPKVDYVNGLPAIIDPDGNWLDIEKGNVLACLDPGGCELAPVDNSLLDYIKNAYDYATGVLKGATDGLKSLAAGARDLTSLFGTFFSWLPNEMVVLMASGLGITVGLRLFRK